MHRIIQDLRHATRGLLRTPIFTLGIVITLALGIGINATMFGVVDALFLRPPGGVRDADGIVRVYFRQNFGPMGEFTGASTTFPTYNDLRTNVAGFADVAAMTTRDLGLGRGADAVQVKVAAVSHQYLPLLGVRPAVGRFFTAAEDTPAGDRVAVLSYGFWKRHYGGADVIGKVLPLGAGSYTVIGVAERDFSGIDIAAVDMFLPIQPAAQGDIVPPDALTSRGWFWTSTIARLKPGVTRETAAAQATVAYRRGVSERRPDTTSVVVLGPIQSARAPQGNSDAKVALWIGVVAGVVLLIACANVANLLLARGVTRRRELAVRASLGAGRAGLMRALLSESLVLAFAGGVSAIVFAWWSGAAARSFLLPGISADVPIVDGRVLLFTAAAVAITALLTGLVPALQASRSDLVGALKTGGHGATARGGWTRTALLVTQVALTLVLLVGAGLFVRSFRNVQAIDPGMDADRVLSVRLDLAGAGFKTAQANDAYLRLLERVARMPGVDAAAVTMGMPFGYSYASTLRAEGVDSLPTAKTGGPYYQAITPDYMRAMGTRIIEGRDFTTGDVKGAEPVALIGAGFARRLWPAKPAVGRCLYHGGDSVSTCTRIVGVVRDVKRGQITEEESLMYYMPFAQFDSPTVNAMLVRVRPGAAGVPAAIRREIQGFGNLPYAQIQFISEQVAPQLRSWRLGASAFTAFGLLALVIAATGIFATLSYAVSQRTKEIGVRVALGAQSAQVVRLIVGQGLRAALIGTVFGALGAYALGRAIASLLYQVPPGDPLVFGAVVVTLLGVATAASYVPASRAARIAPMIALRSE